MLFHVTATPMGSPQNPTRALALCVRSLLSLVYRRFAFHLHFRCRLKLPFLLMSPCLHFLHCHRPSWYVLFSLQRLLYCLSLLTILLESSRANSSCECLPFCEHNNYFVSVVRFNAPKFSMCTFSR